VLQQLLEANDLVEIHLDRLEGLSFPRS